MQGLRLVPYTVVALALVVTIVSAGRLVLDTGSTNADGTLLRGEWSLGCLNNPDLVASSVGPNQCDPQREHGTAWYCQIDSTGRYSAAEECDGDDGCSCNTDPTIDYNCSESFFDVCQACQVQCDPACTDQYKSCFPNDGGLCLPGECQCDSALCNENDPCEYSGPAECGSVTGERDERRCNSGTCSWTSGNSCSTSAGTCGSGETCHNGNCCGEPVSCGEQNQNINKCYDENGSGGWSCESGTDSNGCPYYIVKCD